VEAGLRLEQSSSCVDDVNKVRIIRTSCPNNS